MDEWLARRPALATELGVHAHDSRLDPVTRASVADDVRWLNALSAAASAVPPASLDAARRADRERLLGWAEARRLELETLRPHEHDPGAAIRDAERAIRALLESEGLHPCDRVRSATLRLRRVPEVLRAARVTLEEPHADAVLAAIGGAHDALAFLRMTLPALTRECRESAAQADLAEADTLAVRALEAYRDALASDVLPVAAPHAGVGRAALADLLRAAEAETAPLDSLLLRIEREIAVRHVRLDSLAARIAPGAGAEAVVRGLDQNAIAEGELPASIAREMAALRARSAAHIALPDPRRLDLRWTLIPGRERPAVRYVAPGPLERKAWRPALVYESAGAATSSPAFESRGALLNRATLPWALAHETTPGRWTLAAARARAALFSRAFPAASATEGWCAFAEQLAREWGAAEEPAAAFAAERRALERLALAAAALELHVESSLSRRAGLQPAEATQRIAERTGASLATSRIAAELARRDPVRAIAPVLGAWRLDALRADLRARTGTRLTDRAFAAAVFGAGPLPLPLADPLVRRALAPR